MASSDDVKVLSEVFSGSLNITPKWELVVPTAKYDDSVLLGSLDVKVLLLLQARPQDAPQATPFHNEPAKLNRAGEIRAVRTFRKIARMLRSLGIPLDKLALADAFGHMVWVDGCNPTTEDDQLAKTRVESLLVRHQPTLVVAFGEHCQRVLNALTDLPFIIRAPHPSKFEMHDSTKREMATALWRLRRYFEDGTIDPSLEMNPRELCTLSQALAKSNHVRATDVLGEGEIVTTRELYDLLQRVVKQSEEEFYLPEYSAFCSNYLPYNSPSSVKKGNRVEWRGQVVLAEAGKWKLVG